MPTFDIIWFQLPLCVFLFICCFNHFILSSRPFSGGGWGGGGGGGIVHGNFQIIVAWMVQKSKHFFQSKSVNDTSFHTVKKQMRQTLHTRSLCPVSCLVLCLLSFLFLPIFHLPPFPNPFHLLLCPPFLPPSAWVTACQTSGERAERVNYDKHPLWILSAFVLIKEEKDMNASVVTVITSTLGGGGEKKKSVVNQRQSSNLRHLAPKMFYQLLRLLELYFLDPNCLANN